MTYHLIIWKWIHIFLRKKHYSKSSSSSGSKTMSYHCSAALRFLSLGWLPMPHCAGYHRRVNTKRLLGLYFLMGLMEYPLWTENRKNTKHEKSKYCFCSKRSLSQRKTRCYKISASLTLKENRQKGYSYINLYRCRELSKPRL